MSKSPVSEELLKKAENNDLETFIELDKAGFILASHETASMYVQRLKELNKNIQEMETELDSSGFFSIDSDKFPKEERIDTTFFESPSKTNQDLYSFKINWVPGFFVTPDFGLLFGGCAYSFSPDFFSVFIIRNSFRQKKKWLIYSRDELISHELCHVARAAMKSTIFEETFAYQTSTSYFRKKMGSILRSVWDTFITLGLVFLLLFLQIYQTFFVEGVTEALHNPVNYCWLFLGGFLLFLGLRQMNANRVFHNALKNLSLLTKKPLAILFRCSDQEIYELAKMKDLTPETLKNLFHKQDSEDLRFSIINERFINS